MPTKTRVPVVAFAIASLISACGNIGPYVWVSELPASPAVDPRSGRYLIGTGDLVVVRVFEQDNITTKTKVRADGKIAVPFAGEVDARNRAPLELAREIEERLKPFINSPRVTVSVEETPPMAVSVVGEVTHPGTFTLDPTAGVLQAIAAAGGTTEYADKTRIFVLRKTPAPLRIRFTFEALIHNDPKAVTFALAPGDVVAVE